MSGEMFSSDANDEKEDSLPGSPPADLPPPYYD